MDKITLVGPCYNEQEVLYQFYDEVCRIAAEMSEQTFEFLFVDDGSKDNTLNILKDLHKKDKRVRFISFSRNFGKEAGLYAGLQNATGNYVAVIDADLQHPPAMLPLMYHAITQEGYDCAAARRSTRAGESKIRSSFSRLFYKIMNKITKTDMVDGACDFRMMSRKMVDAVLSLKESNRFSKGIFGWVGFKTKWIPYENIERVAGQTKWSFWSLLLYALDGIIAFSTTPLMISSIMGIIFCFIAFLMIVFIIIKTLIWGDPVAGYPSLVCILFFVSGIQLFCTGILGQYLSKLYIETKNRPIYIIGCTEKDFEGEKDDTTA